jgi:hypothetical protein
MRLADTAWKVVDTETIKNCWKKAGILPEIEQPIPQPRVPISALINDIKGVAQAEKELSDALDQLQNTGVLQASNRMDINFLVNPPEENPNIDCADETEIFKTVMEPRGPFVISLAEVCLGI